MVIIGGGSHGLSTAYYLATHHGITDVAILEKSYIGSGAAGRNTTIIRANYRTPEGAAFYSESVELYKQLSQDLNFNLMFSQHGHFTLAHSDRSLVVQQERAEVNKLLGIDSYVIDAQQVKELCRRSTSRARASRGRFSARSTTHPAGSSDTMPSFGVTRSRCAAQASRSTRTPR